MALYGEPFIQDMLARVRRRYADLGHALGVEDVPGEHSSSGGADTHAAPLLGGLRLLVSIANGERHRTDDAVAEAEAALSRVLAALFGTAFDAQVRLPEALWATDLGVLVSRVRWWISADDLISISAAAILAFGENTQAHRMRIARAIESGALQWVPDPSVANPQQRKRVLRSEVERLRARKGLPNLSGDEG